MENAECKSFKGKYGEGSYTVADLDINNLSKEAYESLGSDFLDYESNVMVSSGPLTVAVCSVLLLGVNPCAASSEEEAVSQMADALRNMRRLGYEDMLIQMGDKDSMLNQTMREVVKLGAEKNWTFDEILAHSVYHLAIAARGFPRLFYMMEREAKNRRLEIMQVPNPDTNPTMDDLSIVVKMLRTLKPDADNEEHDDNGSSD